jgi:hypothetical protein
MNTNEGHVVRSKKLVDYNISKQNYSTFCSKSEFLGFSWDKLKKKSSFKGFDVIPENCECKIVDAIGCKNQTEMPMFPEEVSFIDR